MLQYKVLQRQKKDNANAEKWNKAVEIKTVIPNNGKIDSQTIFTTKQHL